MLSGWGRGRCKGLGTLASAHAGEATETDEEHDAHEHETDQGQEPPEAAGGSRVEGKVSSGLATQLHVVRTVGNVGAHPMDADGGLSFERLLSVEPTEVETLFSALREFFDEIFVRPRRQQRELEALN